LRSPKPLLDALEMIIEEKLIDPTAIQINIAGNIPSQIFEEFKLYKIFPSIRFLGFVSRQDALKEMLNAHLLWLIIGSKKSHRFAFPVKGYEYVGARRHILNFSPQGSDSATIIAEIGCGTNLGIEETDLVPNVEKLRKIIEGYWTGKLNAPIEINMDSLKKYTRKFQAGQVVEMLPDLQISDLKVEIKK
jgi:hypothetical protein